MKTIRFTVLIIIIIFSLHALFSQVNTERQVSILVITGGHDYDTAEFQSLFRDLKRIKPVFIQQPDANRLIESGKASEYNVLLFYDMWNDITDSQKKAWVEMFRKGKGIVFLHHSLAGYQEWDEYIYYTGGHYHEKPYTKNGNTLPASNYMHDLDMLITIADKDHPVTRGLTDFTIHDEAYGNMEILHSVHPLLVNNHPKASRYAAWTNQFGKSRIVCIALGHDKRAYENTNFQKLLENSILWVAEIII